MKKIIMIMFALILSAYSPNVNSYCDGWRDGYCEGWRDVKGQFAVCPITPICPIPEVGLNKYKDGYNRAFKAGTKAAKK